MSEMLNPDARFDFVDWIPYDLSEIISTDCECKPNPIQQKAFEMGKWNSNNGEEPE